MLSSKQQVIVLREKNSRHPKLQHKVYIHLLQGPTLTETDKAVNGVLPP